MTDFEEWYADFMKRGNRIIESYKDGLEAAYNAGRQAAIQDLLFDSYQKKQAHKRAMQAAFARE